MPDVRPITVNSPLGADKLLFSSMQGAEELGRLFQFDLELLSDDPALKFDDLLGKALAVVVNLPDDKTRHFHGIVTSLSQAENQGRYAKYSATLRPWLWLLSRTVDCRIFQEMTSLDIIKTILRDEGFTDFEEATKGTYPTREYCVQYRESDFQFISRLLEEEGIYYYFRHEAEKHVLVFADALSSHEAFPGYEEILYRQPSATEILELDHLQSWLHASEVQPGKVAITDFDFEKPSTSLLVNTELAGQHERSKFEVFDYPGRYIEKADGETYVKTRSEELFAQHARSRSSGNARGIAPGFLFTLNGHPREDQNIEVLVVVAQYSMRQAELESGAGTGGATFGVSCETLPSSVQFRPARITPKPMITGPQTALVVGKAGEEIWTDKYGRVKLQFHWDRLSSGDEKSSCWVRVAQLWAGKSWGGIQIPRMGQEVIVEFLEGDPDRPIITGRVYNAEQMPPYGLPDSATQSGIKSRSSKGGGEGDFNELRFEDKAGSEQVYFHSQKDFQQVIENDRTESVGNDRSLSVSHDKSEQIGNDKTINVTGNHKEDIGKDKTLTVIGNHTESITGNKKLDVTGNHTEGISGTMTIDVKGGLNETVLLDYTESVLGAMAVSVAGAMQISVVGSMNESVAGSKGTQVLGSSDESVTGSKSVSVTKSYEESVKGARKIVVTKDFTIEVDGKQSVQAKQDVMVKGKVINLTADDELTITVGSASITMKKNGDIEIAGNNIKIDAKGDLIQKGSTVAQN